MNHANMYAVGLALCTFADIASEEMSRDLANEIEKLLGSSNTYIRKKVRLPGDPSLCAVHDMTFAQASLCALRVIRKVPDLSDHFIAKAKNLLADRNHGVLLTAITLVTEMCQTDATCLEEFRNVNHTVSCHVVRSDAPSLLGRAIARSTLEVSSDNWLQPRT